MTGLILLIAGMPLSCLASAGHNSPVVLAEFEDSADGEWGDAHKLDVSEWFAFCSEIPQLTPHAYERQVSDAMVATEAALRDPHLQRGPPLP